MEGDKQIPEGIYDVDWTSKANTVKIIISPRDFRVNTNYPDIERIDWEVELYDIITANLKTLPNIK